MRQAESMSLIRQGARLILEGLQMGPSEPHFRDTPERVARSFAEICSTALDNDVPASIESWKRAIFKTVNDEMVAVTDIEAVSMCPHHLLPVFYRAHVGYIPNGDIIGLSKIARIVRYFAAQPIVQEDLAGQIANTIEKLLTPQGVIVMLQGKHTCMSSRGIKASSAWTSTSLVRGCFQDHNLLARAEFFAIANLGVRQ